MTQTDIAVNATAAEATVLTKQETGWLPLLVIRPGDGGDHVCFSDPLHGYRATVRLDALLDLLTGEQGEQREHGEQGAAARLAEAFRERGWLPARQLEPSVEAGLARWWNRGWHPSLSYYLWSRHRRHADLEDGDGTVRRTVLRQYQEDGGLPARIAVPGDAIELPAASPLPKRQLGEILIGRRTVRGYAPTPVGAGLLSDVLHHGLADLRAIRTMPIDNELLLLRSHGTPFEFYIANYRAEGLAPGVYHYRLDRHTLTPVTPGDPQARMARILVGMRAPETAAWSLIMVSDFRQYQWRYRHERALRHLYMSAGRIAQRLIIVGHTLGLGSLPTPATRDLDTCDLLRLNAETHTPVYTLTMGPVPGLEEARHD